MAKIFISHSTKDKAEALQLMHWLESQGFESLFLDSDARHGIVPGSEWEKELYQAMRCSHAILLLLTERWNSSKWCWTEYTQARALGKKIFPLRLQADLTSQIATEIQHLDLIKDRDTALQSLKQELTDLTLNTQRGFAWDKTRPPYPGMLAFEAEDAPVFFGRDAEINRLRERLSQLRTQGSDSLLLMLAASGAGKSSVLKAGLLPRLRRDARHWIVLEALRPEREPLRKLAQVLATACGTPAEAATLYLQLQGEQALATLRDRLQQLRTRSTQWEATVLLSIDQAEELFSTAQPAETAQLLQLLTQAQAEHLPLLTLMVMRGDYLQALQAAADKPPFSLFALDPLPLERVSDLIRGPAAVVGLEVEDGLISAATHDAATADALPLLAFALRELFERFGADGDLTLDEYRRLGSDTLNPLENAVQHKASDAIQPERLSAEALQALRNAFIPHMVRVNDAGDYVRQPARWDDLPPQAQPLLDKLTNARLLVQRSDARGKWVEVAHEALLRHWRLLNGWLREEHDFLLGKQQLEHSLRDWQQLPEKQRNKGLLQGIALERAREWLFTDRSGLNAAEKDYIRQSHQAEEQQQQRVEAMLREANTVINFINFDLRDKLEPIGRLDIMQDIQSRVTAYYNNLGASVQGDELQRQRATNLRQHADTLADQGKLPEAEKLYREALQSNQQRADNDPSNAGWQRDLSVSLIKIADILSAQGKLDDAKAVFEQGQTILLKLADNDPNNAGWQRDLSVSLIKIGDILSAQGKLDDANAMFEQSRDIAEKLADNDPSNAGWQRDFAASLERIGNILSAQCKLDDAKAVFEQSQTISQTLADNDPSNAGWQRNLSSSFSKMGEVLSAEGKLDDAKAVFEQSMTILLKLADNDPSNAGWQRDLSVSLNKIGDILSAQGKLDDAKAVFEQSRDIAQKLADNDPSNAGWQRDLSVSLIKIGDILTAQSKLDDAKAVFEQDLAIAQKLADNNPSNAGWQADLVVSRQKLMTIALEQGDKNEARKHVKAALLVLEPLEKAGLLNASQQGWPEYMRKRLKELE